MKPEEINVAKACEICGEPTLQPLSKHFFCEKIRSLDLAERIELNDATLPKDEWGGCGCGGAK